MILFIHSLVFLSYFTRRCNRVIIGYNYDPKNTARELSVEIYLETDKFYLLTQERVRKINLDDIYQYFINIYETDISTKDNMELDWIQPYIEKEQFLLLEQEISKLTVKNDKEMFKLGFYSAWELINSLNEGVKEIRMNGNGGEQN